MRAGRRKRPLSAQVASLAGHGINYDPTQAPPHVVHGWHRDHERIVLGHESPGDPEPDGLVANALAVVDAYGFTDPSVLRAAYCPGELVGRDILLEGRFLILRFLIGVRITDALDQVRPGDDGPERVIGWSYETLGGHLEQGKLTYSVVKDLTSGRVEFRIDAFSRRSSITNPLVGLGFRLFGRRTQLRFYRSALHRMVQLALAGPMALPEPDPDGLVRVPRETPPNPDEWFSLRFVHPGR